MTTHPQIRNIAFDLGIHTLCPQNNEDWIPSLTSYLYTLLR